MSETICVLDVKIDNCSAKQAMKASVEFMGTAATSVVELVTIETLMLARDKPGLKEVIEQSDLVLPGQEEILEAAGVIDARYIQETRTQTYLRMYLKYLHKNHSRVYLLVETEEEADRLTAHLVSRYRGIQIAGAAKVASGTDMDDMLVNAINGGEVDCVIAILSSPIQEEFIARNRSLINARMWLGAGKLMEPIYKGRSKGEKVAAFVDRMFFMRATRKNRREMKLQG
ncbi:MAG: hypothetical protein HFH11_03850 [Dorea sp.]|jgi:N-acetylglucosaminyldiphosphoundecaprenol N-acetyl-beta-D-mannosaminyltransferase|nr:hypothetical protein [Dorea sp.]